MVYMTQDIIQYEEILAQMVLFTLKQNGTYVNAKTYCLCTFKEIDENDIIIVVLKFRLSKN